jgi:hypothetical protein
MKWFRFYSDAVRNPKVATLSDRDFRLWVGLLSVAAENDGHIPSNDALKRMLSMRIDHLYDGIERLVSSGLIDRLEHGYEPHNWDKFQYKSDTSTPRVTLHRAKTETAPEQIQKQKQIFPKGNTRVALVGFEEFWAEYPNKVGKPKAQEAFSKALTKTDVETLMAGLRLYVSKTDDRPWCNPATWLNQDRWGDQPAQVARGSPPRRRTIADAASDLLKEFQNADIRPEPSNQSIAAPVRYLPASFLDK